MIQVIGTMAARNSEQEIWWRAVADRDATLSGQFVVGVKTTGIYCRPGCPARTPKRQNVEFFADNQAAREAGYRACKRCRPDDAGNCDVDLLVRACRTIEDAVADAERQDLAQLARSLAVEPGRLQRLFERYLGITPRAYAEARRFDRLRSALGDGANVTQAIYEAGFEGPRRVYELSDAALGMTPGRFAKAGDGETIRYAVVSSPLGALLVAATQRGICRIMIGDKPASLIARLKDQFNRARLVVGDAELAVMVATILAHLEVGAPLAGLPVDIQGSAFEARVWKALLAIPRGRTLSYGEIARAIGRPTAARAVGRACGANPVAILIPCHRAIGANGALTGYAWGVERKRELLAKEASAR